MEEFKYCQPSQLYHSSLQIRNQQQQQQHQTQHLIQQLGLPSQLQGASQYYNTNSNTNNQSPNQNKNSNNNNNTLLRCNSIENWGANAQNNRRSDENLNECAIQNNSNVNINYSNQNNNNNAASNSPNSNTTGNNNSNDNRNNYQNMKQSNNLITNSDGSTLVSLVPAKVSTSSTGLQGASSSPPLTTNLSTMLQQVVPSNGHMINILSPSKPSNISELSNSSMVSSSSGSSTLDSNTGAPITKRSRKSLDNSFSKHESKDGKYFERRKRNNVAAKKSRDARKQREDEIAIRASFLEKENSILKAQLQTLKDEAQQLRMLLSQKKSSSLQNNNNNNQASNCSNCSNCSSNNGINKNGHNNNNNNMNNSNGYLSNPQLNGLGGYGDLNESLNLDVKSSQPGATSIATASLYLQHQNQHRHPII